MLVNQSSPMPTRKVTAGGMAGAVMVIVVWALEQFGVAMPAHVAVAGAQVVAFLATYFVRERE